MYTIYRRRTWVNSIEDGHVYQINPPNASLQSSHERPEMNKLLTALAVVLIATFAALTAAPAAAQGLRVIPACEWMRTCASGGGYGTGGYTVNNDAQFAEALRRLGGNAVVVGPNGQAMRCSVSDRVASAVTGAVVGALLGKVAEKVSSRDRNYADAGALAGAALGATIMCDPHMVSDGERQAAQPQSVTQQPAAPAARQASEPSICRIDGVAEPVRGVSLETCQQLRGRQTVSTPAETRRTMVTPGHCRIPNMQLHGQHVGTRYLRVPEGQEPNGYCHSSNLARLWQDGRLTEADLLEAPPTR